MVGFTSMNLSAIDLNLLWVLHVVLEERSVARAAARLHVTSPAVSNSLARLRDALGDPLLVRSGRGLAPTPRALELAPSIARAVAELQHALDGGAAFVPGETTRTFAIACSDSDQITGVPLIAAELARHMPAARLRAVSIDEFEAGGGLLQGDAEAVIAPAHPLPPGVHAADLGVEQGVLVVRRDHPSARGRLTRERFNALRHVDIWLALGRAGIGHGSVEAFFERHGLRRDVAVVVPSFTAAAMVAAGTDLVAGMPRRLAERFLSVLPLRLLELPVPPMEFPMQLLWHDRTHADAGSQFFRELVLRCLKPSPRRTRRTRNAAVRAR
jgi:DNA-binding transcriptional LysR family regulator